MSPRMPSQVLSRQRLRGKIASNGVHDPLQDPISWEHCAWGTLLRTFKRHTQHLHHTVEQAVYCFKGCVPAIEDGEAQHVQHDMYTTEPVSEYLLQYTATRRRSFRAPTSLVPSTRMTSLISNSLTGRGASCTHAISHSPADPNLAQGCRSRDAQLGANAAPAMAHLVCSYRLQGSW